MAIRGRVEEGEGKGGGDQVQVESSRVEQERKWRDNNYFSALFVCGCPLV